MLSWKLSLSLVAVALLNFGCKSELAMPSGSNSIGNGSTLNPLTNPATAENILFGKKAYDSNGNVLTGTLDSESLDPNSTAVPAGYYEADNLDDIDTDLVSANIRSGVTIFGVTGSSSVVNTSGANATASDLLSGKTAYVNGSLVTGTIAAQTLSNNSTAVPAGYYSATNLTTVDADLISANIKSGTTIFGVAGDSNVVNTSGTTASSGDMLSGKTAFVNGSLVTGTIAAQSLSNNSTAVPAGYYSGTNLTTVDADLISANIKSGTTIFGVAGNSNVVNTSGATADATDMLSGKTAYVNGNLVTGTIAAQSLSNNSTAVPAGYYSLTNLTTVDADLISANIKSGITIFGVAGDSNVINTQSASPAATTDVLSGKTAFVNGATLTGAMANRGGSWDLTTAFPGTGYYSGISSALSSSDVCSTKNFLGSAGTAVCQGASGGTNATDSNVLEGKYYWNSSGQSVQGTMTNQGSSWDLTTAFPGTGYYGGISSAISASDVCSNKTFLGASGTAVCNSTFGDLISTMAPRADNATVDLSVPGSLNRSVATISQEVSGASQFTSNHNLVPDPRYDNDGRYGVTGGSSARRHYLVTLVGRPTTTCGTSGSIETRIADCSDKNGTKAFYDGRNYGQNGEGDWKLVTLTADSYEVWRDERTKLIWSDRSSTTYNWCQAAGYASPNSTTAFMISECQAGAIGQLQENPKSICAETELDSNVTFDTNDEENIKGGLTFSSNPSVKWRLPAVHDWELAEINGVRKVLPNIWSATSGFAFWSATSRTSSAGDARIGSAWFFNGNSGLINFGSSSSSNWVICVGK